MLTAKVLKSNAKLATVVFVAVGLGGGVAGGGGGGRRLVYRRRYCK